MKTAVVRAFKQPLQIEDLPKPTPGALPRPDTQWPPRVGDLVYVIETGDLGTVMNVEGSDDDLRFAVDLYPQAAGSKNAPFDLSEANRGAQRRYTPAELMQQP